MSLPSPPVLQQFHNLDKSSPDFRDQLDKALYDEGYKECVLNLDADKSRWFVDYLDEALGILDPSSPTSRKCLRELRSICGARAILPTSYTLSSDVLKIGPVPFAQGSFGDVYHGTRVDGSRVCIKRIRMYTTTDAQRTTQIFCQEAVAWKRLKHQNILPLLGVTIEPLQFMSNWMAGGDLPEYVEKNPNADQLGLLSDIAKGLCYVHSCNVIHGDLKGANILVDDSGVARIADFGFATVTQNLNSVRSASLQHGLTPRWTAPEVLNGEKYSKEADIFSFAMVMIEVFTGAVPFDGVPNFTAMLAIMKGDRPPRPAHPSFTEKLWTLMQRCWDDDSHMRPEVAQVLLDLAPV